MNRTLAWLSLLLGGLAAVALFIFPMATLALSPMGMVLAILCRVKVIAGSPGRWIATLGLVVSCVALAALAIDLLVCWVCVPESTM